VVLSLTYEAATGAGARFYDLDNNVIDGLIALSLIDGSCADKDCLVNGRIGDRSRPDRCCCWMD